MNKPAISFTLFLIFLPVFHGSLQADQETLFEVDALIQKGIQKNKDEIKKLSWILTPQEKQMILQKHYFPSGIPLLLNILLGFGIGSYIQGDKAGGTIGTISGLTTISLVAVPLIFFPKDPNSTYFYIGAAATGIFYIIFEIARPAAYANQRFKELDDVLSFNQKTTFFISPYKHQSPVKLKTDEGVIAAITHYF